MNNTNQTTNQTKTLRCRFCGRAWAWKGPKTWGWLADHVWLEHPEDTSQEAVEAVRKGA